MKKEGISLATETLFSGSMEGSVLVLLRKALSATAENIATTVSWHTVMGEYLSLLQDPMEKEQIEAIISKIRGDFTINVRNCDMNVVLDAVRRLTEEFETLEVPQERRQNLTDMFVCYAMNYIRGIDSYLYHEITGQIKSIENEEQIHRLHAEIERIWNVLSMLNKAQSIIKTGAYNIAIGSSAQLDSRECEINVLREKLGKETLVFLHGRPGIGKSTLAKQYANVSGAKQVYFLKFRHDLRNTILQIALDQRKTSAEKVLEELRILQHAGECPLLIIDNFDEDSLSGVKKSDLDKELNSSLFRELTNSGIPTIITSRAPLCANPYEVKPVEDAYGLFCKNCERDIRDDEKKMVNSIINALHGNTMLLVLVAHIWHRIDNPEGLLESLQAGERLADTISTGVDERIGYAGEGMTIFQQAKAIIDISGIMDNTDMREVMAHMALLPLEGMDKKEFMALMGGNVENTMEHLQRNCWIIYDGVNVCLHPVIRSVVFEENVVKYAVCKDFCAAVYEKIKIGIPLQDRMRFANYAYEIFRCSQKWEEIDITLVRAFYALSDVYDELAERKISRELTDAVQEHIDVVEDKIEYARMLSGIAYGMNNSFIDEKELDEAFELLRQAGIILDEVQGDACRTLDYIRVKGQILSNQGSNRLAYSKCSEKWKAKYLEEAVAYHTRAFEYRERMLDASYVTNEMHKIIKSDLATSYTTLATDYFYMKNYEQAINYHEKSETIRKDLGNENGVCINWQRIIGCVIEMYREGLGVDEKYIEKVLGYYPDLLKSNYRFQAMSSLETNIQYFMKLDTIISNDRRLEKYVGIVAHLKEELVEWSNEYEDLKGKVCCVLEKE